ncbi:MAG: c-type cytochrome [Cellvibrionaceae bacterium]
MIQLKKIFCFKLLTLSAVLSSSTAYSDSEALALKGDVKSGGQMYNTVCKGCHAVSIAPNLRGVLDRPIASVSSFPNYTDALKALQEKSWTKENLDAFLIDPTKFAPGTNMIQKIPDDQKRADMLAFFEIFVPRK